MSANPGHFAQRGHRARGQSDRPNHLLLGAEVALSLAQRGAGSDDRRAVGRDRFRLRSCLRRRRAAGADLHRLGDLSRRERQRWRPVPAPRGRDAGSSHCSSGEDGGLYLAGWTGLFTAATIGVLGWSSAADSLLQRARDRTSRYCRARPRPNAIMRGRIWTSVDGGRSWASRGKGIPPANADALARIWKHPDDYGPRQSTELFRSDDPARVGSASGRGFSGAEYRRAWDCCSAKKRSL